MSRYFIRLKNDAVRDLDRIRKYDATKILDGIEEHLSYEPERVSRARIKRLRGKVPADYRLRIDEWRIFYRVEGREVEVLRVLHKEQTRIYYQEELS